MADGPALALQAALVAALKADAGVSALVSTRIYDEPPQNVVFPYVRIGGIERARFKTDGAVAHAFTFSIEVHSKPVAGRVTATRIAEAVVAALNENEAAVTPVGFTVAWLEYSVMSTQRSPDGESYIALTAFDTVLDE